MSGLKINITTAPQDGRFTFEVSGHVVDVRVSLLPSPYGEGVVMRLLGTQAAALKLDDLGFTGRSPRWCISYKFAAEQAETKVESIDVQVGKGGTLTPVANLTPVLLAGTTVKRASLHNFDQVGRLDVPLLLVQAGPQVVGTAGYHPAIEGDDATGEVTNG